MATKDLPDSGQKKIFNSGAQRDGDAGRGRPSLIPPCALRALAYRYEQGAVKYGPCNWMKGVPLSRYVDSLSRHLLAVNEGDESEDHLGAILWNAASMMWTKQAIKDGKLDENLNDLAFNE